MIDISTLKTKGFVSLPYPADLRRAVKETALLWQQFYALPLEVKKSLPYSNGSDGIGYEYKDGVGEKADHKENLDVTAGGREWLNKHTAQVGHPVMLACIEQMVSLVEMMSDLIVDFAREVEETFGLPGFAAEVEASKAAFFVRFIHYFGDREVGEETATAHVDQSGFTLHLFESHAGLQCLTLDTREWIGMPVSEGETVIIPSMQLQLRSEGKLVALTHRVVATAETAHSGRCSAVCFIQLPGPKYDKERCGLLRRRAPGFNYNMSHEEFKKLVKV